MKINKRMGGDSELMVLMSELKAWRKTVVLHALRNCESSVSVLISAGSSFHQVGAKAKKALFLVVTRWMSRWLGISSRFA